MKFKINQINPIENCTRVNLLNFSNRDFNKNNVTNRQKKEESKYYQLKQLFNIHNSLITIRMNKPGERCFCI